MSASGHSRRTSGSVSSRSNYRSTTPSNPPPQLRTSDVDDPDFQPCASTSSMFLYAQGKTVYCLHHDSLAVERRFEKHKEKITILAVDTVSERGQGRLVVSYDAEQTAIVWDMYTGEELARFSSFEPFQNASWMKNGNIAFGSGQGNVIIFEPSTTEHKSRRTIFDPITAIAPASDCQTYAIGYQNGSVLIASLEPQFTILHTLSTSRAPSPVAALAWHASSSKQRSDMLAIQMADGDLRVWSVAKSPNNEAPKVIRVLKRGDDVENGRNWISWSKNGRVLQYSQGETWSWDVRTKHVAYEQVPTVEEVRGIANYGPNAVLFTLGPEGSVQQYELNPPSLVRAVQPDADERASAQNTPKINPSHIIGAAPPAPIYNAMDSSRQGAHSLATIQEATSQAAIEHATRMRNGVTSPVSTSSRAESVSSRSSAGTGQYSRDRAPSVSSRAPSGTVFSAFSTPMIQRESVASPFWASASVASSGRRSRGSRLKNEVLRSPEAPMVDLFPFTRQRLASLPYAPQNAGLDQNTASATDLRRQMLHIVFGWEGDIDELIRGEMNKHPQGSTNAALLGKWLGETNLDPMSMMMSNSVSSTDWMLLALSNMNGNGEAGKEMGRALAQKHITQGDIHTAATIYVGIEELEEAVDIYVSRNYFMEGILLTALLFPDEWQRQAFLVRRWGEYVVENSQQHLAIRCFTCTGADTSVPWASPNQSPFTGSAPGPSLNSMISPPTSPDGPSKAQMMTAKNPALRLITSFGSEKPQYKFPGLKTDDGTPTFAPGVTPIADSALSPGGTPGGVRLPKGASLLGKATGNAHSRLPSIGETPIDINPPMLPVPNTVKRLPTPETSGSDREKELEKERGGEKKPTLPSLSLNTQNLNPKADDAPLLLSATVYNPNEEQTPMPQGTPQTALKGTPQTAHPAVGRTSHSEVNAFNRLTESASRTRNGSRDRKPNGLHIQMPSLDQINLPQLTAGSDRSGHHRGRNSESSSLHSGSTASGKFPLRDRLRELDGDLSTGPLTGKSWASSAKSPSVSGRSMDQYISSLEEANFHAKKKKEVLKAARSKERKAKVADNNEASGRGRSSMRYVQPSKRSPSSPVPMSPEDFRSYRDKHSQSIESAIQLNVESSTDDQLQLPGRSRGASKGRSASKFSEMSYRTAVREVSPDTRARKSSRKGRSRAGSRLTSPERLLSPIEARGRSTSKGAGSHTRSPSSPLPFSPQAELYREGPSPDPLRLVAENKARLRSRQSSRQRSTSRVPRERGSSRSRVRTEQSRDRRTSERPSHQAALSETNLLNHLNYNEEKRISDPQSDGSPGGLKHAKSMRTIKKEQAARELEARRVSLIAHSQQAIAHPSELSRPAMPDRAISDMTNIGERRRGQWTPPEESLRENAPDPFERSKSTGPLLGLPATPRAMKHPRYQSRDDVPAMPTIPDQFYATGQPKFEPSRSASAPVPEPDSSGNNNGIHPAYQRNIRPSTSRRPSLQPLHEIGRPRQGSIDAGNSQHMGSIDGALHPIIEGEGDNAVIIVPESRTPGYSTPTPTPPPPFILPQLAHLASGGVSLNNQNNNSAIPPPPPPPPVPPFADHQHHSLSSGSGVGTINIVMDDDESPSANMSGPPTLPATAFQSNPSPLSQGHSRSANGHGHDKPLPASPHGAHRTMSPPALSPPANTQGMANPMETFEAMNLRAGTASPPMSVASGAASAPGGHRRGRSIDGLGGKAARVFERMRSNSRGRNEDKVREREAREMAKKNGKSPRLLTEGFGEGVVSGLRVGERAPYETAGSYF